MAQASSNKQLCEALLRADTEESVIAVLRKAGYWDNRKAWRFYGDVENNWGQSGNQQSMAEAALAEKIVNSVDARLINECRARGIDPETPHAPQSVRAAVSRFFEDGTGEKQATGGRINDWSQQKLKTVAEGITLTATGARPGLSLTISDCGEGQTPERVPETILSLNRSNKMRIPFVQGQFNQGGTGALRFCGKNNLQLVVSRRNPTLADAGQSDRDAEWSFTVVRRERPTDNRRSSVYTYLAPIDAGDDAKGKLLTFAADRFGIFPDQQDPYGRESTHGTAIKLFDYQFIGERSNILRGRSLFSRLDLLLPEIALPVRVYEYRSGKDGSYLKPGSRETTLNGLLRRLDTTDNVEADFPVQIPFAPLGEKLVASVYAFKPEGSARGDEEETGDLKKRLGGLRRYRKSEGVLFVRNGQTHGSLPKDYFKRDVVKMRPLADDLLIFIDCDKLSAEAREELFMASRDRLIMGELRTKLIRDLDRAIADCEALKDLRNRRQRERLEERSKDEKPLADVLQSLIRRSPNLVQLLQHGQRIPDPFKMVAASEDRTALPNLLFYPTHFSLRGAKDGLLVRECPVNNRARFTFDTDARDDYFTRKIEGGEFDAARLGDGEAVSLVGPTLKGGVTTVMLDLPTDANVGEVVDISFIVRDSRSEFNAKARLLVKPAAEKRPSPSASPRPPSKKKEGGGSEQPNAVMPPVIKRVFRADWDTHGFDEQTAMVIVPIGYEGESDDAEIYEFKVNMDNAALLNEMKMKKLEEGAGRNQFLYANVLIGLSMLLDSKKHRAKSAADSEVEGDNVEQRVATTCRALAPFVLAITALGDLEASDDQDAVEGLEEAS